jgi:hypothetical protein
VLGDDDDADEPRLLGGATRQPILIQTRLLNEMAVDCHIRQGYVNLKTKLEDSRTSDQLDSFGSCTAISTTQS